MPLDFSRITAPSTADSVLPPREIFAVLPNKQSKYTYLRDVQSEVVDQWFSNRNSRDLRLKMNTGGGKTVVGLLILKSCLNENVGPAAFIAPTPYLVGQIVQEANELGVAVDTDPRSINVAKGRAILVTSIHTLINGKSKFGVGAAGVEIPIGSFVLDDAHACLAVAEGQFTLRLPKTDDVYEKLLKLFRPDLEAQSSSGVLDIESGDPHRILVVPFWAWQSRIKEVELLLHSQRTRNELLFVWPLLKNYLRQCRCVFGEGYVEVSPRCLPVEVIPSFARAQRRIFMSATFADDSVLVTDFDAAPEGIKTALAPSRASDIGDRMILVPQDLDPSISDDDIKKLVAHKANTRNVVVIVPSSFRAGFWSDVAKLTLTADTLDEGVKRLQSGHVGVAVIVNKYDGIDLPNDACRVLVLDGLPDVRRNIDRVEQSCLQSSNLFVGKTIQQIEQGMGRGVRATDDYCVVLLMGRSLVAHLSNAGVSHFSPATLAQLKLSEQVGDQIRNKGICEINNTIDYCLNREKDWVRAAKAALVHVKYTTASDDLTIAIGRRRAFDAAVLGDHPKAVGAMQEVVNGCAESKMKGWLMAELAEYVHTLNAVDAQQILRAAVDLNRQVPNRPQDGITYVRIDSAKSEQATRCIEYLRSRFDGNPNGMIVAAHAIEDDLAFRPSSYRRFERACRDAAFFLGFSAQQPEAEFGKGPDVLWAVGGLKYFIIECKNEATNSTVSKDYCNQLAGSGNWFHATYDNTCSAKLILIHPSSQFERAATPPPGSRVITAQNLPSLCAAFIGFCVAVSRLPRFGQTKEVAALLTQYKLTPELIIESMTSIPSVMS